jgi:cytochrome c oxidase subunit 1
MNEKLGHWHFWPSLVCMNFIFTPMLIQGIAGVNRRLYDGGAIYPHAQGVLYLNVVMSWAAGILALAQIPFFINFVHSIFKGEKITSGNPWESTTLEWATSTPTQVYRGPYEYNVPGADRDYSPQYEEIP